MSNIQRSQPDAVESALVDGDLSKLSVQERIAYYRSTCESLGLNPLTKPFAYLKLNGRLVLYPLRDCTDQLRKLNRVSITIASRETVGDCYIVTARASMPDGRCDESTGVVPLGALKGENLANAYMKAETKAKRRATLSICGLGMVDDSEVDSIPGAQRVDVEVAHAALPPPPDIDAIVAAFRAAKGRAEYAEASKLAKSAWPNIDGEHRDEISYAMQDAQKRIKAAQSEAASESTCGDGYEQTGGEA